MDNYSIAHSYVYGRVRGKTKGNLVDRKRILEILRYIIRIPGPHQLEFFEEMIKSGFFKKVSRDRYEILTKNIKEEKIIVRIMKFIDGTKEPFKQKFLDLMKGLGYISIEEGKYKILTKNTKKPKDFYGNCLWG
jgi:hypothetical protein